MISNDARKRAEELHRESFVLDAHFDLLPLVLDKRLKGEKNVIERDYLPGFRAGNVNAVVSSLFVSERFLPEMGLRHALDMIAALYEEMAESPGLFSLCRNTAEIAEANARGEVALLLSFEGLDPIGNDLSLLRVFYELGVRGIGLVWSRRNYVADGCFFDPVKEGRKGGLTAFGVQVLDEAKRLGMYIDISHLNDEGVEDVLALYDGPVIASHSNCRALAPVMRNLTDEQILRLAGRGGVMGMNSFSVFVADPDRHAVTERDLADHADHIRSLVGDGHVGLGFDFCDEMRDFTAPGARRKYDCIKGYGASIDFTAELLRRGYGEEAVRGILGGSFLSFLRQTIG